MTMNSTPSCEPMSWTTQMLGCCNADTDLASCSKRARRSSLLERCAGSILIATLRCRRASWAAYTSPIPPWPMSDSIKYGPIFVPGASAIGKADYSCASRNVIAKGAAGSKGKLPGGLRLWRRAAMTDCELMQIDKTAMMLALPREHTVSDLFVAYLLARNIRYEEDLVDQLFNSSEKRLARILLLLAHFGKDSAPDTVIPKISQESLAEMIGTTRSRVSFFMNRFRKLGFIHYNGGSALQVHSSLLNVVPHD